MSLKDIDIKASYAGKGLGILKSFLIPAINTAVSYDRVTSYYTVESLLAISQGIQSLFEKKGKMRLIIGIHNFPNELIEASLKQEFFKKQIEEIREEITLGIMSLADSLEKERLATLAWMIQDGLLQVKAASVRGEGIFHPKTLILADEEGNRIAAVGSPNETGSGLGGNFEQIMVAKSWESQEGVTIQETFFDTLWNNKDEDAIVEDITSETAVMIENAIGSKIKRQQSQEGIISMSSKMLANFFVSGDIPALYMHQERAVIDALSRWPVRVLFSDEVGLGKTFEVAASMAFLTRYCGVRRVLILTPKSVLQQWQDELREHFGIDAWLYHSEKKLLVSSTGKTISRDVKGVLSSSTPEIILMSAQLARGSKENGSIFDNAGIIYPDLLVVDEAHSARIVEDIGGNAKKTRMYQMLEKVGKKIPHLILATATPMQKNATEYHAMLKLLGLPKAWEKKQNYLTSLSLISRREVPDLSDAYMAASLLHGTISTMNPSLQKLSLSEIETLENLNKLRETNDKSLQAAYVQNNWISIKGIFIKLHPAHLLTVRNTRKSLERFGYKFPKRNLQEKSINDSEAIELFYDKVNDYLTKEGFTVENILHPLIKQSIGFVRISYRQRVASSLYSCMKTLTRRLEKIQNLKSELGSKQVVGYDSRKAFSSDKILEDWEKDDQFTTGEDIYINSTDENEIDYEQLKRAIEIESVALTSLIKEAGQLIDTCGDMKVIESIKLAIDCLEKDDTVLVFSRYTDTIDALLLEFRKSSKNSYKYGIYTGKKVEIVEADNHESCDKNQIKKELFSGRMKLVFCSDAASEGLNLQAARVLINTDVPWTPARLEQRIGRIARLGQLAQKVDIYNVWYPRSIEAKMYHRIQKRLDISNIAVGEFPEVIANEIKLAVIDGMEDETNGIDQLNKIRKDMQIEALSELWNVDDNNESISESIRKQLIEICDKQFDCVRTSNNEHIKFYSCARGEEIGLSELAGLSETISLKSKIWNYYDCYNESILVIKDKKGNPVAFASKDKTNQSIKMIKYESINKIINGQSLEEKDFFDNRPQCLPDNTRLDLTYSIECEIDKRPNIWI